VPHVVHDVFGCGRRSTSHLKTLTFVLQELPATPVALQMDYKSSNNSNR
jgi:hypothetical protein